MKHLANYRVPWEAQKKPGHNARGFYFALKNHVL